MGPNFLGETVRPDTFSWVLNFLRHRQFGSGESVEEVAFEVTLVVLMMGELEYCALQSG